MQRFIDRGIRGKIRESLQPSARDRDIFYLDRMHGIVGFAEGVILFML
jgi:hypothetical protein